MPRGVKKQDSGLNTDFSITDAAKRAAQRRKQLEAAGGNDYSKTDDLSNELDRQGMSDYEKEVFDN